MNCSSGIPPRQALQSVMERVVAPRIEVAKDAHASADEATAQLRISAPYFSCSCMQRQDLNSSFRLLALAVLEKPDVMHHKRASRSHVMLPHGEAVHSTPAILQAHNKAPMFVFVAWFSLPLSQWLEKRLRSCIKAERQRPCSLCMVRGSMHSLCSSWEVPALLGSRRGVVLANMETVPQSAQAM